MNKNEWRCFYSILRAESRLGASIATFGMDFSTAYCIAVPEENRRFYLCQVGFERKFWHFALTLYGVRSVHKLRDLYHPLTTAWRRRGLGLPCRLFRIRGKAHASDKS